MRLQECLKSFGWCGVGAEKIWGLSSVEIKVMLETCEKRINGHVRLVPNPSWQLWGY